MPWLMKFMAKSGRKTLLFLAGMLPVSVKVGLYTGARG